MSLQLTVRHGYNLGVPSKFVMDNYIGELSEQILALQHYPNRIFCLVHGIVPKFMRGSKDMEFIPTKEWMAKPEYINWFSKLGELSISPFFMKSPEKRALCLLADMLPIAYWIHFTDESKPTIKLNPEDLAFFNTRCFDASINFWMYCHCSKCNSKTPVDSLINQFKLNFTFENVSITAEKLMEEGYEFKIYRERKN